MRAFVCAIVILFGAAQAARATTVHYVVSGTFTDGETLGGSFSLDDGAVLPGSIFGSTLTIGGRGAYARFVGASMPPGVAPNSWLDIQFLGAGILSLQVPARYDLGVGRVYGIGDGALRSGAVYGNAPNDLVLASGSIAAMPEPTSLSLLGVAGLLIKAGAGRRPARRVSGTGMRFARAAVRCRAGRGPGFG